VLGLVGLPPPEGWTLAHHGQVGFFRQLEDAYQQSIEAGLAHYHSKRPTTRRCRVRRTIFNFTFFALCIAGVVAVENRDGSLGSAGLVGIALTGAGFGLTAWGANRRVKRRSRASALLANDGEGSDVDPETDHDKSIPEVNTRR
jgi:hypothetical protein